MELHFWTCQTVQTSLALPKNVCLLSNEIYGYRGSNDREFSVCVYGHKLFLDKTCESQCWPSTGEVENMGWFAEQASLLGICSLIFVIETSTCASRIYWFLMSENSLIRPSAMDMMMMQSSRKVGGGGGLGGSSELNSALKVSGPNGTRP